MAAVALRGVKKAFGAVEVIHGVDLETVDGEFVALVGPSGCGKSTLLRMIAGLEGVTEGAILIDGREVNHLSPRERNVAMVFQSYALYPHMTVRQNMEFNLKLSGLPAAERRARVEATARLLEIADLLERRPGQLSGGQRQRVAMGRAVVRDPALFLFDEPLSNLDAKLRVQMRAEIKALHQKVRRTSLYVTHDQIEAMTLADRIVVLNHGRIEQVGSPMELYRTPANLFVAGFIGSPAMNLLDAVGTGGSAVKLTNGTMLALDSAHEIAEGRAVVVGLRPEHLVPGGEGSRLSGTVRLVEPTGALTHVSIDVAGQLVVAVIEGGIPVRAGDHFDVSVQAIAVHVFDRGTGLRVG